jgi:hypothetical protein
MTAGVRASKMWCIVALVRLYASTWHSSRLWEFNESIGVFSASVVQLYVQNTVFGPNGMAYRGANSFHNSNCITFKRVPHWRQMLHGLLLQVGGVLGLAT